MPDSIAITAVGLTCPLGKTLEEFRSHVLENRCGLRKISLPHIGEVVAGTCDFNALLYQSGKELRHSTRGASIAIYCARQALERACLRSFNPKRVGVYIGITEHGTVETEKQLSSLRAFSWDLNTFDPYQNLKTISNNPAGAVAGKLCLEGPAYTLGGACAAGLLGLIEGARALKLGECDFALCGGVSESTQSFLSFASFQSQGLLSKQAEVQVACRPFDKNRSGLVVSEGGCLFVLEREKQARKRGGKVLGVLESYQVNSGGKHASVSHGPSQVRCMRSALKKAGLESGDIDWVNAHATGTKLGDLVEAESLWEVFGQAKVPVNNLKSLIGHTMGASGALELAVNLPAFEDGIVHACCGLKTVDKLCPPICLPRSSRKGPVTRLLKNAFGMWGIHACAIVKAPDKVRGA